MLRWASYFSFGFPERLFCVHFYVAFRAVSGKEEALGMVVARLHLALDMNKLFEILARPS